MPNPFGKIEEQWVAKLLPKFHDDPTVNEGVVRADLPRLHKPDKNPKILSNSPTLFFLLSRIAKHNEKGNIWLISTYSRNTKTPF